MPSIHYVRTTTKKEIVKSFVKKKRQTANIHKLINTLFVFCLNFDGVLTPHTKFLLPIIHYARTTMKKEIVKNLVKK